MDGIMKTGMNQEYLLFLCRFAAPKVFCVLSLIGILSSALSPLIPNNSWGETVNLDRTSLPEKKNNEKSNQEKESKGFTMVRTGKGLSFHKPMYFFPATWANDYHSEETEIEFQISAKQQIMSYPFYIGYTQKSLWQAYNSDESSPFRETNYNPEFFYRLVPEKSPLKNWGADVGIEHESNGRDIPISRSWNRIYAAPHYSTAKTLLYLKFWWRIPEDDKESPMDTSGDDNPDITDYLGYGEIHYRQQFLKDHMIHLMVRGNTETKRGAFSVNYSFPTFGGNLFIVMRLFHGYGETLIDYNDSVTRIGAGMMICR